MAKINFQNMNSMVGQDAIFRGDMKLDEGIIVYGTVFGNISTQGAVRVSRTGKVVGNISSSDIHIGGNVEGNVIVESRAILGEASLLNGNLTYKSLIIEEGAQFQGQCIILGNETENDEPQMNENESVSTGESPIYNE
jgi:cytoskeletal protein CcmA (bactofilin family)